MLHISNKTLFNIVILSDSTCAAEKLSVGIIVDMCDEEKNSSSTRLNHYRTLTNFMSFLMTYIFDDSSSQLFLIAEDNTTDIDIKNR